MIDRIKYYVKASKFTQTVNNIKTYIISKWIDDLSNTFIEGFQRFFMIYIGIKYYIMVGHMCM